MSHFYINLHLNLKELIRFIIHRTIILATFILYGLNITNAQISLSGIITDKITGESLVGVNIYLPEFTRGTISENDGSYVLKNLRTGQILVQYSMMGYKTQLKKIKLGTDGIIVSIQLEPMVIQGEEITVTGGFPSSQHENAIKISILKTKSFLKSGTPSLIETLSEIPGVDLISKGPGVATPIIRGLSLSNILFLNNGIPMNNFQFSENHPYMVDDNGIARIEIIKGPASLLHGSGAVGGVLNLIKEAPPPEGSIQGDYLLKYYGNTSGLASNLGIKGTINSFTWGVRAGLNSHMDYFDGEKNRIPNSRFNRYSFKTNLGLIKKFGTFRLFYDYNKDLLGMTILPTVAYVSENGRQNEVWFQDLANHIISMQNKLFIKRLKFDLDLGYQSNNRKLHGSPLTQPILVNINMNSFNYKLQSSLPTNDKTKIIIGLQGLEQRVKNYDAPQWILPNAQISDFSLFGFGQHYHWEKLMIQAGLRWDYRFIHVPEQISGGHSHDEVHAAEDSLIKLDNTYQNFSFSLGSVLNLRDSMHFRFNIASAFRSPNLAELTQNGEHGVRFEQGNATLKSQRNLEADLSFHYHSTHLNIDVSGFYNNIHNYIFLAPTNDTIYNGNKIYRYTQTPAFLYGGEAMIHFHPHPLDWLHLKSSWSYVQGKQSNGNYLPFIPAQKIKFELELQKRKWAAFRNLYYRFSTDFVFRQVHPAPFETASAGYVLINTGLGSDIKVKNQLISIGVFANNLLNKTYISHLSTLKELGLNNMGRNVSLMLKIPFGLK